jgi:hypothetical protein
VQSPEANQYLACETGRCGHDLARAVGIAELWRSDGPFGPGQPVVALEVRSLHRFADDEAPAAQQRWAV